MTLEDIKDIVAQSFEIGYLNALQAIEPSCDELRQAEVKKWLKTQNIRLTRFDALVSEGMVRGRRKGKAVNSPIYYSKKEIKQALLVCKVEELTNNN